MKIKRGDAYGIPVLISQGASELNISDVELIEFVIGGYRKLYPGEVSYEGTGIGFSVPLSQEETFSFSVGAIALDIRVKFVGGAVDGIDKYIYINVVDSESEEVI